MNHEFEGGDSHGWPAFRAGQRLQECWRSEPNRAHHGSKWRNKNCSCRSHRIARRPERGDERLRDGVESFPAGHPHRVGEIRDAYLREEVDLEVVFGPSQAAMACPIRW